MQRCGANRATRLPLCRSTFGARLSDLTADRVWYILNNSDMCLINAGPQDLIRMFALSSAEAAPTPHTIRVAEAVARLLYVSFRKKCSFGKRSLLLIFRLIAISFCRGCLGGSQVCAAPPERANREQSVVLICMLSVRQSINTAREAVQGRRQEL